jgi:hypothetical protein
MCVRRLTGWLLVLASWLTSSSLAWAGPEIFALSPESGSAGCTIAIKGKGLKTTQHVLFAVGRTVRKAFFRIISDAELQVTAPECYRPGAAATVAVLTPSGLTVAMPAAVQVVRTRTHGRSTREPGASFDHVLRGGWVDEADSVALIESGGVVARSVTPAMHLVKRGGALMDFSNRNGLVFYEPGALFGNALMSPRDPPPSAYIAVPRIMASPGVGPFIYEKPAPALPAAPAGPPWIRSVVPGAAGAGEVITLSGRGMAGTSEVLFMDPDGKQRAAGFRMISDELLKVEIPDLDVMTGEQVLVVSTTEGLTVTVPRQWIIRPAMATLARGQWAARLATAKGIDWVAPGDRLPARGGSRLTFVEPGGTVTGMVGTFFIKQGGTMLFIGGAPKHIYFEPGAMIPDWLQRPPVGQEVRAIVPSFFDQPFVVLAGPRFRP